MSLQDVDDLKGFAGVAREDDVVAVGNASQLGQQLAHGSRQGGKIPASGDEIVGEALGNGETPAAPFDVVLRRMSEDQAWH